MPCGDSLRIVADRARSLERVAFCESAECVVFAKCNRKMHDSACQPRNARICKVRACERQSFADFGTSWQKEGDPCGSPTLPKLLADAGQKSHEISLAERFQLLLEVRCRSLRLLGLLRSLSLRVLLPCSNLLRVTLAAISCYIPASLVLPTVTVASFDIFPAVVAGAIKLGPHGVTPCQGRSVVAVGVEVVQGPCQA